MSVTRTPSSPPPPTQESSFDPLGFLGKAAKTVEHAAESGANAVGTAATNVFHGVSDFAGDVGAGIKNLFDPPVTQPVPTPGPAPKPQPTPTPTPTGPAFPYINQMSPSGADGKYTNGPKNCGPTAMAMVARHYGLDSGQNDAQLVEYMMSVGSTTPKGTTPVGMLQMAQALGLRHAIRGPSVGRDWDFAWADQHLSMGHQLVVNGDYAAEPGHSGSPAAHYIVVYGKDANGNYLVRDPLDAQESSLTPAQLQAFNAAEPNLDPVMIAVGQ